MGVRVDTAVEVNDAVAVADGNAVLVDVAVCEAVSVGR